MDLLDTIAMAVLASQMPLRFFRPDGNRENAVEDDCYRIADAFLFHREPTALDVLNARDQLAIAALPLFAWSLSDNMRTPMQVAEACYDTADNMLLTRERRRG